MAKTTIKDLTKFIPLLKNDSIGELIAAPKNDGSPQHPIQMAYVKYTQTVLAFMDALGQFADDNKDLGLYNYLETVKKINMDKIVAVDLSELSHLDKKCILAILVWCVRGDRFCEGFLLDKIKSGLVVKCLEMLEEKQ